MLIGLGTVKAINRNYCLIPMRVSRKSGSRFRSKGHQKDFVDVLFFPDEPKICDEFLKMESCGARNCKRKHGDGHGMKLYDYIREAEYSVDVAAHAFTSHHLAGILAELSRKNVQVRVIRDYGNTNICKQGQKVSSHGKKAIRLDILDLYFQSLRCLGVLFAVTSLSGIFLSIFRFIDWKMTAWK